MKTVLSFGGGLQTTAMAIMVGRGDLKVDAALFSDTGAERPETYWYIDAYVRPLLESVGVPLIVVPGMHQGQYLYERCIRYRIMPDFTNRFRWCTDKHKVTPLRKFLKGEPYVMLIGFSADEAHRAHKDVHSKGDKEFPLIDRNITASQCVSIIADYGWPRPLKSSCFFCPFQRQNEWNWLKGKHPDLFQKALELEAAVYERRPDFRDNIGLYGGKPLWWFAKGQQAEFGFPEEYSCWSGFCGH